MWMGVAKTVWEKGVGNHLSGSEERVERGMVIYVRLAGVRREGEG